MYIFVPRLQGEKISLVFAAADTFFETLTVWHPTCSALTLSASALGALIVGGFFHETSRSPINELLRTAKLAAVMDAHFWSERDTTNR
jgi:hypothetical protein